MARTLRPATHKLFYGVSKTFLTFVSVIDTHGKQSPMHEPMSTKLFPIRSRGPMSSNLYG